MLVSGSNDRTIKLWDMQTGGVVKTFQGHTYYVCSVSISPNCTTIASGSGDNTIRLWDIQTGECHCIIQQKSTSSVHFLPLDPHHFISTSDTKVQKWNIDGHKIGPDYHGFTVAFSLDGTKLVLCGRNDVWVQSSDSGAVITKFHMDCLHGCFSPDGRLVAVYAGSTAYVWDITSSEPSLIETFIGYTDYIQSLVFPSPTFLISTSGDKSVRFWQIGTLSTSPDVNDPKPTPHTSPIKSITLQAKDGITISSDLDGVVKIWDLLTGLCKASFQTPAKGSCLRDAHLIDNRLVLVWDADNKIHIWDVEKGKHLQKVDPSYVIIDLRISGDGSKVFCMGPMSIHAFYILTGEVMGKVEHPLSFHGGSFVIDCSKVWAWVSYYGLQGWDFGVPEASSIKHDTEP